MESPVHNELPEPYGQNLVFNDVMMDFGWNLSIVIIAGKDGIGPPKTALNLKLTLVSC